MLAQYLEIKASPISSNGQNGGAGDCLPPFEFLAEFPTPEFPDPPPGRPPAPRAPPSPSSPRSGTTTRSPSWSRSAHNPTGCVPSPAPEIRPGAPRPTGGGRAVQGTPPPVGLTHGGPGPRFQWPSQSSSGNEPGATAGPTPVTPPPRVPPLFCGSSHPFPAGVEWSRAGPTKVVFPIRSLGSGPGHAPPAPPLHPHPLPPTVPRSLTEGDGGGADPDPGPEGEDHQHVRGGARGPVPSVTARGGREGGSFVARNGFTRTTVRHATLATAQS